MIDRGSVDGFDLVQMRLREVARGEIGSIVERQEDVGTPRELCVVDGAPGVPGAAVGDDAALPRAHPDRKEKNASEWRRTRDLLGNLLVVGDGECLLGITMEYAAYSYVVGGAPIRLIYPEEGTVAQPEGSAIIANAPNLENARLFQDVVNSTPVRERTSREFYRRPARNDIVVSDVAPGSQDISDIRMAEFDFDWAAVRRSWILENAQSVIMGQ